MATEDLISDLNEDGEEQFLPTKKKFMRSNRRPITGSQHERAKKFSELRRVSAKRYNEKRQKQLRQGSHMDKCARRLHRGREKSGYKKDTGVSLPSFRQKLNTFRHTVINIWNDSPVFPFCEWLGCQNLPGQDEFNRQVDHILDRDRFRDLVFTPENGFVSCGCHENLTFNPDGSKRAPESMLEIIKKHLPDRAQWAEIEMVKAGRL